MKAKRIALWGVLAALAVAVAILENCFELPFLPPGAKPGLSNIITVTGAMVQGFGGAIYIAAVKSLFTLITRGLTAFIMSASGGLLSAAVSAALLKFFNDKFSLVGIGIAGALTHNLGQLAASRIVTGSSAIWGYAPALALCALASGTVTGLILKSLKPYINKHIGEM